MVTVFISYSHKDKQSADAIDQWLRNKGVRVLYDDRDFIPAKYIETEIVRCIEQAGKVVCIYSKNSSNRPYVELERRIATSIKDKKDRLVYFCIDNTELPSEAKPRLAIYAYGMSFNEACEKLWQSLMEISSEPLEIDLTQYRDVPPWKMTNDDTIVRKSSSEIKALFNDINNETNDTERNVIRIEMITEGPVGDCKSILEKIVLSKDKYCIGEIKAAELALRELKDGCPSNNLLKRVKDELNEQMPEHKEGEEGVSIAAFNLIVTFFHWNRPDKELFKWARDSILKLAFDERQKDDETID